MLFRTVARLRYMCGWPPVLSNSTYRGVHVHPGRDHTQHGYPHPKKRDPNKVWKFPNVRAKACKGDFHMGPQKSGLWAWSPPYPPRVNPAAEPWPKLSKNKYEKPPPTEYPLKWKNIEYKCVPHMTRKPHGGYNRWKMDITRIVHGAKDGEGNEDKQTT